MTRIRPLALALALILLPWTARAGGLPEAPPQSLGFDAGRLAKVGEAVERAVARGVVPGAVVLVGRGDRIAYAGAFGQRAVEPEAEPMTRDTVFDMASLTKPVATATSVMVLLEQGRLRLTDPITRHLPELDNHGKKAITVDMLLRHRTGLIADNPLADYADGPEKAWERIAELEPLKPPGEAFLYSDVNFLILGRLVERLSGQTLDAFAAEHVFRPLGMGDTAFRPTEAASEDLARIAPTEKEDGRMIRGVVHDPRSRALGGVAGHAGLFGTADDLALYAAALLGDGRGSNGARILSPLGVRRMIDPADTPEGQRRALGWDVATSFSSPKGSLFGPTGFGHTGFTGTSLWIDPETRAFVVLLTSRLHPDGKRPAPSALRSEVATLAAAAIVGEPTETEAARSDRPGSASVACGIDVLARDGFKPLKGKRVGLVTNHTGRTRAGGTTIDALFEAPEVKLVALFSPEHGIRGLVDAEVDDSKDEKTGLHVFSLYGKTRKPTQESLEGVEILVYDIQDIGTRFYTYISTLGLVLEAAAEAGIPVVVLDRPNPIGGLYVGGPIRDDEFASFIAHHALPVVHGMTVGEIARMFNAERGIKADLTVIPCEGWERADLFDRTGLVWVNPSPNMRSLTEALLYPGVGLLEATNLATGRGTDTPFERIGAPWIDPAALAARLNGMGLPGLRFVPHRFTPKERQFANQEIGGVQITIVDRDRFDPIDLGLGLAVALRSLYPEHWKPDGLLRFIADRPAYDAILAGKGIEEVKALWKAELDEFLRVRSRYLIYR